MARARVMLSCGVVLALVATAFASSAAPKKAKKKKPAAAAAAATPKEAPAPKEEAAPFDRATAASVLSSIDLAKCRSTNAVHGEGHVAMTFAPSGSAVDATVDRGPMAGTPTAKCIAKEFKKAKVPAFSGDPVTVGKNFQFE